MSKSTTGKIAKTVLATLAITAAILGTKAQAAANFKAETTAFTPVFGKTLPPIGYVNFCARNLAECRKVGGVTNRVTLTRKNWKILHQVNHYSNTTVKPVTDLEQYNLPEFWSYPTGAGDCEDFVLQKKRYLEGLGFPAETLLITVVLDEKKAGHAVLTVRTDRGDFILDNMRNDIRRWNATGYTFIKRQSQYNPQIWVSLTNARSQVSLTTVAGGR